MFSEKTWRADKITKCYKTQNVKNHKLFIVF